MKDVVFVFIACFGVLTLLAGIIGVAYLACELCAYMMKKLSEMEDKGML